MALGNYVLPCEAHQAAVTVRGHDLTLDLGAALLRGSTDPFEDFGEQQTHGIGLLLDGTEGGVFTLRGGTISGFHYGVKAVGLTGGTIEGTSVVNNRRLWSDARRENDDPNRGIWLDFLLSPEEDETEGWVGSVTTEDFCGTNGAGIALLRCSETSCRKTFAAHNTVGITDFYGRSNCYEENDLCGCPIGVRFWQAKGSPERPIKVARNVFHFNTQPCPWWWSGGDGGAILGAGLEACEILENEFAFSGDGVFLGLFPRLPSRVQGVLIRGNRITHAYAHGIEVDFAQDCTIQDNTISHSLLSGVWAGHAAGLLILGNVFEGNNRGRLFSGWTDSQGAISCPQGRVNVAGNIFRGNWVGVNLRQDDVPAWWLFSGDNTRHIVAGNIFRDNQIAVRLWEVHRSDVQHNLMQGNIEDITGEAYDNRIADNGAETDPSVFDFIHVPVEALLFDSGQTSAVFAVSGITAHGITPIRPVAIIPNYPDEDRWLEVSEIGGGLLRVAPNRGPSLRGIKTARLNIEAAGKSFDIPVKLMVSDALATVGRGESASDPGEALGKTPIGPSVMWGTFAPISSILQSEGETTITGSEPFWCRFSQPEFQVPGGVKNAFVAVFSDDQTALSLGGDPPVFTSSPPDEDTGWYWATGHLDISTSPTRSDFTYIHRETRVTQGVAACVALWLYPLDAEELAEFGKSVRSSGTQGDYRFTMPGARKTSRPPSP